jgi:thiomorpholine-carboxylate dehydrogenase
MRPRRGNADVPYISEAEIRQVLHFQDLIPAMEQALIDFSAGRVRQPVRSIVPVPEHAGFMGVMPAVYGDIMGTKLVNFYPENTKYEIPTHLALIATFRATTGEPLAVLDGRLITEMRTAAVSAAVARLVAPGGPLVLAILGSGVQALAHYRALSVVRSLSEIRIWSRNPEHARRFAVEMGAKSMSAEQAVRNAGVIVTATSSRQPVLHGEWLRSGALVLAVGAVGGTVRELDDAVMQSACVVVDSRDAAMQESGDILLSGAPVHAEVGELFAGAKTVSAGEKVVFKSLGLAVEDLASARLVLEKLGFEL